MTQSEPDPIDLFGGFEILEEAALMLLDCQDERSLLEIYRCSLNWLLIENGVDQKLAADLASKFVDIIVGRRNEIALSAGNNLKGTRLQ